MPLFFLCLRRGKIRENQNLDNESFLLKISWRELWLLVEEGSQVTEAPQKGNVRNEHFCFASYWLKQKLHNKEAHWVKSDSQATQNDKAGWKVIWRGSQMINTIFYSHGRELSSHFPVELQNCYTRLHFFPFHKGEMHPCFPIIFCFTVLY